MRNCKFLICLGLVLSLDAIAYEECDFPENIMSEKNCSEEFFHAKNEKELDSYLKNGKFKNGKRLNLEIMFNHVMDRISVSTSCDVRIASGKKLLAERHGICIKARNIETEVGSSLIAGQKSNIYLEAEKNVIIRKTNMETKGNINVKTNIFLPFDGEISFLGKSIIKAKTIKVSTKSNLQIDNEVKLRSENNVLDGGHCEIGQEDEQSSFLKKMDGLCRKFEPYFSYHGRCKDNSITNKIKMSITSKGKQNVKFEIKDLSKELSVFWRFDEKYSSVENDTVFKFAHPGRHFDLTPSLSPLSMQQFHFLT